MGNESFMFGNMMAPENNSIISGPSSLMSSSGDTMTDQEEVTLFASDGTAYPMLASVSQDGKPIKLSDITRNESRDESRHMLILVFTQDPSEFVGGLIRSQTLIVWQDRELRTVGTVLPVGGKFQVSCELII